MNEWERACDTLGRKKGRNEEEEKKEPDSSGAGRPPVHSALRPDAATGRGVVKWLPTVSD